MHMRTGLLVALLVAIAGCDSAGGDETSHDPTDGESETEGGAQTTAGGATETDSAPDAPVDDVNAGLMLGYAVGTQLVSEAEGTAQAAAQAVEFATATVANGSLVTTGTVRQRAGQFAYDPTPSDALVVDVEGHPAATLHIEAMHGDFSSAAAFLSGSHEFRYAVQIDGSMDMEFVSLRSGSSFETAALGELLVAGTTVDVDATARGTRYSEVDTSGSHYQDSFAIRGSVEGSGYSLDLDETWDFELVTVSGTGGGSAQSAVRTVNSTLRIGADRYTWAGVRTQKSYRDGRPSSLDTFWVAEGELLRNGERYGEVRMDADLIGPNSGGFVLFVLELPGSTVELERIGAY